MTLSDDERTMIASALTHSSGTYYAVGDVPAELTDAGTTYALKALKSLETSIGAMETSVRRLRETQRVYRELISKLNQAKVRDES